MYHGESRHGDKGKGGRNSAHGLVLASHGFRLLKRRLFAISPKKNCSKCLRH